MPLLDLLYLEESQSETVISAVRKWCAAYGCHISDDNGKKAVAVAVRLARSVDGGEQDFLTLLSEKMAEIAKPQNVSCWRTNLLSRSIWKKRLNEQGFLSRFTCPVRRH